MACSSSVPSRDEMALCCSLWIVNQVLVRLWTRRTPRVVLASLRCMARVGSGLCRGVRGCIGMGV